jgi:hypothetical protein
VQNLPEEYKGLQALTALFQRFEGLNAMRILDGKKGFGIY